MKDIKVIRCKKCSGGLCVKSEVKKGFNDINVKRVGVILFQEIIERRKN